MERRALSSTDWLVCESLQACVDDAQCAAQCAELEVHRLGKMQSVIYVDTEVEHSLSRSNLAHRPPDVVQL